MNENILSQINRNINILKEKEVQKKKIAINEIYEIINKNKINFNIDDFEKLTKNIFTTIIDCIEDISDEVREKSTLILYLMIRKCDNITELYPYIIEMLYSRLNAYDLEDILKIPEVMRPTPENKPMRMIRIKEKVEEIRMNLLLIFGEFLELIETEYKFKYIDDLINILRTFLMDPWGNILIKACRISAEFFHNNRELLFNYPEILGRSLLLPLINKKSKVVVAAINSFRELMYVGCFKHSVHVLEMLIGFQDPNSVAIKDFYDPGHSYNYFAILINHPKIQVREIFIETVAEWLTQLPDREEHAARFLPYLLSGLFDKFEEIQIITLDSLEELGILEERNKEKNFRDAKQFGVDANWNFNGKVRDIKMISPLKTRPRLGIRNFFQINMSKIVHPICRELKDSINLESRLKSSFLLKYLLIFIEETVITHLDLLFPCLLRNMIIRQKEELEIKENIKTCLILIGRYVTSESFESILFKIIEFKYSSIENSVTAGLEMLLVISKGYFEILPEEKGLFHKINFFKNVINFLSSKDLLNSFENKEFLILNEIFYFYNELIFKRFEINEILEICNNNNYFYFFLSSQSFFNFNNTLSTFNENKYTDKKELIIKNLNDEKLKVKLIDNFLDSILNHKDEINIDDIKFKVFYYILKNDFNYIKSYDKNKILDIFFNLIKNDTFYFYIPSILTNIYEVILKNDNSLIEGMRIYYIDLMTYLLNKFYKICYDDKNKKFKNYKKDILSPAKNYFIKLTELKLDFLINDDNFINKFKEFTNIIIKILDKEFKQSEKIFYLNIFNIIFQKNINNNILLKIKDTIIDLYNNLVEVIITVEYNSFNNSNIALDTLNIIITSIIKNKDYFNLFKNNFNSYIDNTLLLYINVESKIFKDKIYKLLYETCKHQQNEFSILIKQAEESQKLKRFEILKDIWKQIYYN